MNYDKFIDDLKEVQTNLYLVSNRLAEEYKEDNIMYDVSVRMAKELSHTYRHIAQSLYLIVNGGNKVIKPIMDD